MLKLHICHQKTVVHHTFVCNQDVKIKKEKLHKAKGQTTLYLTERQLFICHSRSNKAFLFKNKNKIKQESPRYHPHQTEGKQADLVLFLFVTHICFYSFFIH